MNEFLPFAHQLADAAGAVIRPYFGAHGAVEEKRDASPVTIADRAAEQAMRALIAARFPTHGIFGEEFGVTKEGSHECVAEGEPRSGGVSTEGAKGGKPPSTKNYTWVLDPIDGTRAFIAGEKEWGTLIALCENGVPVLGILDQPVTGERWVGVRGSSSLYRSAARPHPKNAQEHFSTSRAISGEGVVTLATRPCASLAQASISSTSKNHFTPPQAAQFVKLAEQCAHVIEDGDCYAYGLLARGARDVVVDAGLKPYDILALVPIVQGAGGFITNWQGGALTLAQCDMVVASGDTHCHAAALACLDV